MTRLLALLVFLVFAATFAASFATGPGAANAAYPAAELSTEIRFECLPDHSVRVDLQWATYNQGTQWVDVSVFDNDFAPGTYLVSGPLAPNESRLTLERLVPGVWHFARVNTLAADGWHPSPVMSFLTPDDCRFAGQTRFYPPAPPTGCLISLYSPVGSPGGCVWTARPDYDTYFVGDTVVYCFSTSQAGFLRLVVTKPDGSSLVVFNGYDPGSGACIGPFQAYLPPGLRLVSLYGGASYQLLAQTHFYVR